ncbi:MAG: Trk system potassium transporter TrkA [Clostridia bacterium]|nr:Trk system potassium transporter TrkA [Clostridia bacterium]
MKILIVGCGKIGATLLKNLVDEGHDVVAIDSDVSVLEEVTNVHDVMSICGNGADSDVLEEAGAADADIFVAVTGSDEFNMLACFLAKKMGAKYTVARIRKAEYNDRSLDFLRRNLELDLAINPERLAAHELFNIHKFPSAVKIESFSRRQFEMIEIRLGEESALDGMALSHLREKYEAQVLVCCVRRGEEVYIPDGNFVLKSQDRIGITAPPAQLQKFLRELALLKRRARSVMILGASRTALYLAELLLSIGASVKIIEKDEARAAEACEALPRATVIHGDGASQELLLEEGLSEMDAFAALTGFDEENILLSIFAASRGVKKTIAKVNREEFASLAEKLGVDTVISPKQLVGDTLTSFVRALENSRGSNVELLYKVMDEKVEAMEFKVVSDARLCGIPLKSLNLKKNVLIAGIVRERKSIAPTGESVICAGDRVIVIAPGGARFSDLSDILA